MSWGFVYCMANESMPGMYKIGFTSASPYERAIQLSKGTGVPSPYIVLFYADVPNPSSYELMIHEALEDHRVSGNREFFKIDVKEIHEWVYDIAQMAHGAFAESQYYLWSRCDIEFEKYKQGLSQ